MGEPDLSRSHDKIIVAAAIRLPHGVGRFPRVWNPHPFKKLARTLLRGPIMNANDLHPLPLGTPSARLAHDPSRVLVAEDDGEMLRLVVEALRKDGYDVTGVSDGGGLIAALGGAAGVWCAEVSADLVVTDVRMPVCGGVQILRGLRGAHCSVPVILMTAFGDEPLREYAHTLGAVLFGKPFDLKDLRTVAALLLRGTR